MLLIIVLHSLRTIYLDELTRVLQSLALRHEDLA